MSKRKYTAQEIVTVLRHVSVVVVLTCPLRNRTKCAD